MWPALLERLDGNALKALFYMLTFESGDNNGDIYMGARTLGEGIHVDKKTALRCLQHLDRQGFIRPQQLGYFTQKGGLATRWRLTFLPANGKAPTNEWRQAPAEQKSWAEIFPDAGGEIPPAASVRRATGGNIGPVEAETDQVPVGKNGTHTIASADGGTSAPIDAMRAAIGEWWRIAKPKERIGLAKKHKIEVGELSSFVAGLCDLPIQKAIALRTAVIGPTGKAA
jgi:hypothetical protein